MATSYFQTRRAFRSVQPAQSAGSVTIPGDPNTGKVAQTVTERLDEMVYVTSYGVTALAADNSTALNALFARGDVGDRFHFPPGVYDIGAVISLRSNLHITADPGATVRWTGAASATSSTASPWWILREASIQASPLTFSTNVSIRKLRFEAVNKRFVTILAVNIRGLKVIDCEFYNCGGLRVTHELMISGVYDFTSGAGLVDPAVTAGFSATLLDDLSEDIEFTDNKVNGVTYNSQACRLDFVRRFVVANNICKYAAISWWGGAASHDADAYGGLKIYLRRVTQGVISGNYVSWTNGGIYGNNGSHLAITGNTVEFIVDTGLDLEGCMHCTVTGNAVKYCGNFCMSIFYASQGNVFSYNTCVQGPLAANMNTQAGTASFPSSLGRSFFTQISALSDLPYSDVAVIGNTFTWDGTTGFGTVAFASYTNWKFEGNVLRNVVFDSRSSVSALSGSFKRNRCYYSNTTSVPFSVYIALAVRKDSHSFIVCEGNEIDVTNESASTVILLGMSTCYNGLSLVRIENNTVVSATATYPIGFGDMRTRTGTPTKVTTLIRGNTIRSGTIKDLGIITLTASGGYAPTVVDVNNYTAAGAASAVNVTPNTSVYGSMVFGSAVLGGTAPAVPTAVSNSSLSATSATTTCTPSYPTSIAANDIALLVVWSDNDSVIDTPAGFTAIGAQVIVDSGFSAWMFWARLAGSESGTITVTRAASTPALSVFGAKMSAWRGCPTTGTPFEGADYTGGTATDLVGPTIAVSGYSRLAVMHYVYGDDLASVVPSDWTQVSQTNSGTGNDGSVVIDRRNVDNNVEAPTRTISGAQPFVAFGLALVPA